MDKPIWLVVSAKAWFYVKWCRSFDTNVYLQSVDNPDGLRGWVDLESTPGAQYVAAAAEAAGKAVLVEYRGYDPNWGPDDSGRFSSVVIAFGPF